MKQEDITVFAIVGIPFVAGLFALAFTAYLWCKVKAFPVGDENSLQVKISGIIQQGAMAFLRTEYLYLVPFVLAMSVFFFVEEWIVNEDEPGSLGWKMIICFIIGACLSAASGWGGMLIATDCNVRTAEACRANGLTEGLKVAFAGGAVMGFIVVGLGIVGLTVLFFLFASGWKSRDTLNEKIELRQDLITSLTVMAAFSFGASAIALFARVAGGIYTKAADVGADLVGKVEEDFPEDSFYNPATIADNVGDNVGDVAGMGADLFESYVGSIVAAATLAMTSHCVEQTSGLELCGPDMRRVALPFWVAGFGIIASMLGYFAVGCQNVDGVEGDALQHKLLQALHSGVYSASAVALILAAVSVFVLFGVDNDDNDDGFDWKDGWKDFACLIIGLATGIIIGEATEYFTSFGHNPTRSITTSGVTGPATVIIQGLGVGMLSAVPPVLVIAAAVMSCSALSGVYGAALAAVGMLATLGVTLATDAYGPVADNAGGVAEMSHLDARVREKTDALDALGNTTAATGKGFAVGSAVLTALAFMNAFSDKIKVTVQKDIHNAALCRTAATVATSTENTLCDTIKELEFGDFFALTNPLVLSGLLIGAMLPFLFAALTMLSVGKAATGIILEVRRQLTAKPLLRELVKKAEQEGFDMASLTPEEKAMEPDFEECVTICTKSSLKEMLLPGVLAVMTPIGVGLLVGARCLGGILMGAIATGFLLAVMMNNAGGAWDNSKKWVENDGQPPNPSSEFLSIIGKAVKKGTEHHSAVVTGDTVGDPFKDTSGPALNILIKLMSVLSLTCAGIFRNDWDTWYSGVAVLAVEMILCAVIFYYVWQIDDTMSVLKEKPGTGDAPAPAQAYPPAGSTEKQPQVEMVEQPNSKDARSCVPPSLGCDTGGATVTLGEGAEASASGEEASASAESDPLASAATLT
jgi:inorganic pyrophosphatase